MQESSLILVEGIPGTGKSTAAQFIARQLRRAGRRATWFFEELPNHPVRTLFDTKQHDSPAKYAQDAVAHWRTFAMMLENERKIAVLDGALLQNHFRSLLYFNTDPRDIISIGHQVIDAVSNLNPTLIYLQADGIPATIERAAEVRGQRLMDLWLNAHSKLPYRQRQSEHGKIAFFAFWQEFEHLAQRFLDGLKTRAVTIAAAGADSATLDQHLTELLDLPPRESPPPQNVLTGHAGTYAAASAFAGQQISIEVAPGQLIASVLEPTIRIDDGPFGCFRTTRLIPTTMQKFDVAGWPYEAVFGQSPESTAVELRLESTEPGWASTETWRRIRRLATTT